MNPMKQIIVIYYVTPKFNSKYVKIKLLYQRKYKKDIPHWYGVLKVKYSITPTKLDQQLVVFVKITFFLFSNAVLLTNE